MSKTTLEWLLFVIQNAPAGVQTIKEVKDLFMDGYNSIRRNHSGEMTRDELIAKLQADIDEIEANSNEIQKD